MEPLAFILCLKRSCRDTMIKMITNAITEIQDKKANATKNQLEFER